MWSMTGYGKGAYDENGVELTCEIKTVNNRYLDVSIKAPRIFSAYEEVVRGWIKEKLTRGHADVFISLKDKRESKTSLTVDLELASSYVSVAKALQEKFPELPNDFTLTSVLRYPDVLKAEDTQTLDEELTIALKTAVSGALDALNQMRKIEGEKLKADMLSRMQEIENLVGQVEKRAPLVAQAYKTKLTNRVKEYLDGANIDEELTRLHSHIEQFRSIATEGVVGRKLDFLVQEFNREANTTCSKSNDVEITRLGLALKNEIEKVREQVQNVE